MIDVDAINGATTALGLVQALGLDVAPGGRPDRCRVRHHGERNASCDVATKHGRIVYRCRSCGAGGDAIALAADVWGMGSRDFVTAARRLADLLGVRLDDAGPQAPRRRRDLVVELAQRIEAAAEDFGAGRAMRDADAQAIEGAGLGVACTALALLAAADADERDEDARRAEQLERLADAWEARRA